MGAAGRQWARLQGAGHLELLWRGLLPLQQLLQLLPQPLLRVAALVRQHRAVGELLCGVWPGLGKGTGLGAGASRVSAPGLLLSVQGLLRCAARWQRC